MVMLGDPEDEHPPDNEGHHVQEEDPAGDVKPKHQRRGDRTQDDRGEHPQPPLQLLMILPGGSELGLETEHLGLRGLSSLGHLT